MHWRFRNSTETSRKGTSRYLNGYSPSGARSRHAPRPTRKKTSELHHDQNARTHRESHRGPGCPAGRAGPGGVGGGGLRPGRLHIQSGRRGAGLDGSRHQARGHVDHCSAPVHDDVQQQAELVGHATAPGPAVGTALAAAINDLSSKKRNVVSLDGARKQLQVGNDALGTGPSHDHGHSHRRVRQPRNCPAALAQNGIGRTKAGVAVNSANAVINALVSRRAQLAALAQAATTVERAVTAQGSTLASMPNVRPPWPWLDPRSRPRPRPLTRLTQSAVSLRDNAIQVSANGSQILSKTC